jgi:hypothetical protein
MKNRLKNMAAQLKLTKLELKNKHRNSTFSYSDFLFIQRRKWEYRTLHVAYTILKKNNWSSSINYDRYFISSEISRLGIESQEAYRSFDFLYQTQSHILENL